MGKELLVHEWLKRWGGKGKLQAFQDAFARAFGISLCLVNLDGKPLTVWSNSSLFCHYMMKDNRRRCLQERNNAIRQALATGRPCFSRCYLGLTFFFRPVMFRQQIVCFVYGGGFCCDEELASRDGGMDVPVLTKKQFENMLALLEETINLAEPQDVKAGTQEREWQGDSLLRQKLSNREIEIVRLINAGWPNKEIGEQLFISEKTVKTHMSNILAKMGMKDRTQLILFCRQNNIN